MAKPVVDGLERELQGRAQMLRLSVTDDVPFSIPFARPFKETYVKQALSRINELVAQGEFDD